MKIFLSKHFWAAAALTAIGCHSGEQNRSLQTWDPEGLFEKSGDQVDLLVEADPATLKELQKQSEGSSWKFRSLGAGMARISGDTETIRNLKVEVINSDSTFGRDDDQEKTLVSRRIVLAENEPIVVERGPEPEAMDETVYYLAKEEFGIPGFLQTHPEFDGRGVKVGVIDDGISPRQSGFQKTTTGERKYLNHGFSQSSWLNLTLEPGEFENVFIGKISEKRPGISEYTDLNKNSQEDILKVEVQTAPELKICVDSNASDSFEATECFGQFSKTGEYGYWDTDRLYTILAEWNDEAKSLTLTEGERDRDGHGEGVGSVMSGHSIAGRFDGVAPGTQLLDYDISVDKGTALAEHYTMSTFLEALAWMGENGAQVVNISYSLFFQSVKSQGFMRKALQKLVDQYQFILTFSAGNNGPGLASFNRGLIYPQGSLVAAAYVSPELNEYVHGTTGLPPEGRVVWYSSRGVAPDFGTTPSVLSPLASLSHSSPERGFRAFSGTSSAAPALGGFVAVLLSAIQQSELPMDISAVVSAVRSSAKPLPGIPFAEQGTGLPNIEKAFEQYKQLVSGEKFASIRFEAGSTEKTGQLLFLSQNRDSVEFEAKTSGILPTSTLFCKGNPRQRFGTAANS